jgi:hypothetical protein
MYGGLSLSGCSVQTKHTHAAAAIAVDCGKPHGANQEQVREVILDVVGRWAGERPQEIQLPRLEPESRADGAFLVELLGVCGQ